MLLVILVVILGSLDLQTLAIVIIPILSVLVIYITISFIRSKKRYNLLDTDCDPEAFLYRTEKQKEITGKNPKVNACLDIDRAAALIASGQFEKAKEILLSIDKKLLSHKNGTLLVYTINLISCLYELGEVDRAEELFETQIPILSPVTKKMMLAVNMLVAERFFHLKRYNESREHFKKLWKDKLSIRKRLEILYRLAQIDEIEGNTEDALKKYRKVADNGNKLWIAAMAREKCGEAESRQGF